MITVHGFSPSGNCHKVRLLLEQLGRAVPLGRDRQRHRRNAHAGIPGEESQRQGADARARRRPRAGRVERDPVLARRRHAVTCRPMPGSARRRCAGCSSSSTATSPTSRSRASSAAGRRPIRRAAPNCRACANAAHAGAGGDGTPPAATARGSPARTTASPTSRCSPTPMSPSDGGFDLAPYPAIRDWLARVRATPRFVAMPDPDAEAAALIAQSELTCHSYVFPRGEADLRNMTRCVPKPDSRPHERPQPRRDLRRQLPGVRARLERAAPTRSPRRTRPILDGSALDARGFRELFESQLISRHLDLMARVLRVQNKVFYTIGSSGHEGNAMVARLTRHTDPAFLHYRSRRLHGRALPQAAGHGSDHGFGAVVRRQQGRSGLRRPPQGVGQQAVVGVAADLDDRLAPAQGARHRDRDRAGARASATRCRSPTTASRSARSAMPPATTPPRRPRSTPRRGPRTRSCRRRCCSCARTTASASR